MANSNKQLPRGLRNNNPGNIRRSKDKWVGLKSVQEDPDFFQFREMSYGYRAMLTILRKYRKKYGDRTVADMIRRWAPVTENDTAAYVMTVCSRLQVPKDFEIDVDDRDSMCALVGAMSFVENGREADMEDIRKGWNML